MTGDRIVNEIEAMTFSISLAKMGLFSSGDVPVGAVIIDANGNIISTGHNQRELIKDSTAHAELIAIKSANKTLSSWRLEDLTLVVTLEPCLMCAGAILQSRVNRVVFGAWDEKAGACGSVWDVLRDGRSLHKVEVIGGVLENECAELLSNFFSQKR
jgi:tRNA(adenine34) deaminase